MSFEEIPENKKEQYPCECGGNISKSDNVKYWECDSCEFKKEVQYQWKN